MLSAVCLQFFCLLLSFVCRLVVGVVDFVCLCLFVLTACLFDPTSCSDSVPYRFPPTTYSLTQSTPYAKKKLVLAQPSEQGLEGLWQRLLYYSLWHPGKACSGKARWGWCHTTGLSCFPLPQAQTKTGTAYNASKLRVVHTSKSRALSASGE
jgi:hypothetical protein